MASIRHPYFYGILMILLTGCQGPPVGRSIGTNSSQAQALQQRDLGVIFDAKRLSASDLPGPGDQWDMQQMQVPEAWKLQQGSDRTIVAMVDTGCDLSHPELADHLVPGTNITDPGQPPQDDLGHGTATAGIVGASQVDGQGLWGVAPRARLMPVKVNVPGTGEVRAADAAAGIVWATDHGANIISMSLGFDAGEEGLTAQGLKTLAAAIHQALSHNVLVVCAAGNIDQTPITTYPACWAGSPGFEGLISVGALDNQEQRASYSNFGPWLTVTAPADDIPALAIGGFGSFGGTSAAAPHVSGLAALLVNPAKPVSVATLRNWITSSAQDLGPVGPDPQYGAGCVDALKAVQASMQ